MQDTLSDERVLEIRKRLNQFCLENPAVSNRSIANNIGLSAGTISLFRNNKYNGNNAELAERIEGYLNNEQSSLNESVSKGVLKFALTTAAQDIFKVTNYALTENTIGVVAGVPGCGKTIAVQEYKQRNRTTILIQVTPLVSQRSLIQDICLELKIPVFAYSKHSDTPRPISNYVLFKEIVKQLSGTKRILILDEGENLTVQCIEVVRRIQDFTGIGLLLSGTPKLLDRLRGPRKELQQLFSRVGIWKEINLLQIGDVKAILQVNFPDAMKFANTFLQLSKHNGRLLQHLITLTKRTVIDTGEALSDDLIDEAAGSLLT
jgi:DNA transposition AAA+ family ATPase